MSPTGDSESPHPWRRGAAISVLGALIGAGSLALFCHALGLNFRDEGWADDDAQRWQNNLGALISSLVGFIVAVLLFWLGFFQTTRK